MNTQLLEKTEPFSRPKENRPAGKSPRRKLFDFPAKEKILPFAGILLFSAACHIVAFFCGNYFAVNGSDSVFQTMFFIPFLQKALSAGHGFWSWSYGLGGDAFGGFTYYYTTSPFFYLMLLTAKIGGFALTFANTLRLKLAFSLLKQTLSMAALYVLLKYEGHRTSSSLAGAFVYGGCLCFLWFSLSFDFMTDSFVWLPLCVLGLAVYRRRGRSLLFILSAALCAANSFYFGFISYILILLVILIFASPQGADFREKAADFSTYLWRRLLMLTVALGLSAAAFIPSLAALLTSDRLASPHAVPLFYSLNDLLRMPEQLFAFTGVLGFPLLTLLVLTLPFRKLNSETKRKTVLAAVLFLFYLIPFFGSFFNGFSYISERWLYLFIFAVAWALPNWMEENDRFRSAGLLFFGAAAALDGLCYFTAGMRGMTAIMRRPALRACLAALATVLLLPVLFTVLKKYARSRRAASVLQVVSIITLGAGCVLNSGIYLCMRAPNVNDSSLRSPGLANGEEQALFRSLTPSSNDFYRVIFEGNKLENTPLADGYYGVSTYNSLVDGNLHRYLKRDMNIRNTYVSPSRFSGFDDRLFPESAFAVKYIVAPKGSAVTQYGFEPVRRTPHYIVYQNRYFTGFSLWYEHTVSSRDCTGLDEARKDGLLLRAAKTDGSLSGVPRISVPARNSLTIDWKGAKYAGAALKGGLFIAGKNASVVLPLNNPNNDRDGEILLTLTVKPVNGAGFLLSVNGKSTTKMSESYPYAYPLNRFTFRLRGGAREAVISLSPGRYSLTGIQADFNSYKNYSALVSSVESVKLQNLRVEGGRVSGTVKNGKTGVLALNIPYSRGWSAWVDGKRQTVLKINGMFSGLLLRSGRHQIRLRYTTPGLVPGIAVSAAVAACLVAVCLFSRRKRRQTAGGAHGGDSGDAHPT